MSCGVGCRRGSDPALLWLWRRPVATAPIQSLAWEPPYAAGAAQEIATTTTTTTKDKKKKKQNKQTKKHEELTHIASFSVMLQTLLLYRQTPSKPKSFHTDEITFVN